MKSIIPSSISRIIILVGITGAIMAGCALLKVQFRHSVDRQEGTMAMEGLSEEVIVRRDDLGIPYIEAKNEDDLSLASGYAMASDRLWQMTIMKMAAQGRLSELLGKDMLPVDIYLRTLGIKSAAEHIYEVMTPELRTPSIKFAEGVNAYISAHRNKLPMEFVLAGIDPPPWQPQDSIYIIGIANLGLSDNLNEELAFLAAAEKVGLEKAVWLFPIYPDEDLAFEEARKLKGINLSGASSLYEKWDAAQRTIAGLVGRGGPASNNMAIAGTRTQSGYPIVENDTHLDLTIPSMWMIMHLKSPQYDAAGVMFPGVPLVNLGFNGRVAWGATMVMADTQDIFLERLRTEDGKTCYEYMGKCVPVIEREEIFNINGSAPQTRIIKSTIHGPLLNEALKEVTSPIASPIVPVSTSSPYGLALRWTMSDGDKGPTGLYSIGIAGNIKEARKAFSFLDIMYLNMVYADKESIAWQATGNYPRRKKGLGLFPSPGWNGEYDWDGYLPFSEQPFSINPHEGIIVTANNRTMPKGVSSRYGSAWIGPDRAERIRQLLDGKTSVTYRDVMEIQADQRSLMAVKAQKVLFEGRLAEEVAAKSKKEALLALDLINPKLFDAVMGPGSASAAVMGAFFHFLTRNIFLDELGPEEGSMWRAFLQTNTLSYSAPEDYLLGRDESPFWDNIETPEKETKADILAKSLYDAYKLCEERMGPEPEKWQWGVLHAYRWVSDISREASFLSPVFDRGPIPAGGDMHTVNIAGFTWGEDFNVWLIPAMRLVVDFGLEEPAFLVVSSGQSGNPASEHYDDMIPIWVDVKNHPLPFKRENILSQYKHALVLKPKR